VNPETEVAVTVGASQALFLALQTLLSPGDEVLLLEPFFDLYVGQIHLAGGKPSYVPLHPDGVGGWNLDIKLLRSKITAKTRVLVLNSPHNPTGKVFTEQEMKDIAAVVREHPRLIVVSDEVYKYVIHSESAAAAGGTEPLGNVGHVHFAKLDGMWDRTLTVSSAGKTFSVTGWQVGWIIGPSKMVRDVQTMLPFVQVRCNNRYSSLHIMQMSTMILLALCAPQSVATLSFCSSLRTCAMICLCYRKLLSTSLDEGP
jgi:kynurenine--oxoglutarate transaminase/cysteine-S-conjugate beta-lyase/glutamine--phenylpyruvate transaminase